MGKLVVAVAYDGEKEAVVIRSDATSGGPPFQTMFGPEDRADMRTFANEYEIGYPSGPLVDCGAARSGESEALRIAEKQHVCGL